MSDSTIGGQLPISGWYPDPNEAGTLRYWDGAAWSEHTATGYGAAPAAPQVLAPYQHAATTRPGPTFFDANRQSLFAVGLVAVYLALAMLAGIVLLGVLPILAAVRAIQGREPMAPLAMVVAIGAVVFGFMAAAGV